MGTAPAGGDVGGVGGAGVPGSSLYRAKNDQRLPSTPGACSNPSRHRGGPVCVCVCAVKQC